MSEIKGLGKIEGPRALAAEGPVGAAPVAGPQAVVAPAAADPLVALFDAVKARFPGGVQPADRGAAVRAVVDEVLGQQLGHLAGPTRAGLAAQVTETLLSHPDLSQRLERLLAG